MAPYFTCEFDGRQKLIRQLHGLKLAERQGDQLFAQALQGTVFIFFRVLLLYSVSILQASPFRLRNINTR